jgi:elongation factor P--(R)-beta-lysine ligase
MQKKISLKNITNHNSGYTAGRVELININVKSFFLTDQTGTVGFSGENITFKEGDIIGVFFQKNGSDFFAEKTELLNGVKENPCRQKDSPFVKLNKNNKKLALTLKNRQIFMQEVRNFFNQNDFLEMQSPTLVESPGIESYIEPFETKYVDFDGNEKSYYLPTSPEFALKEALGSGLERIFEIAKVFRNSGENSKLHRPDFLMLEWYRAYENYENIMDDCENLIKYIAKTIYKKNIITFKNRNCDISKVKRITIKELFANHNINLDLYSTDEKQFINEVKKCYDSVSDDILTKDDWFFKYLLDFIEPELGFENPVIIYEYPFEMAALSRRCPDPLYAERFEMYICGVEIANAFGELINPDEQKSNFEKTLSFRKKNNSYIKLSMPERFLKALDYGLPPCSGIALGLERLFMLFENLNSIDETNFFGF